MTKLKTFNRSYFGFANTFINILSRKQHFHMLIQMPLFIEKYFDKKTLRQFITSLTLSYFWKRLPSPGACHASSTNAFQTQGGIACCAMAPVRNSCLSGSSPASSPVGPSCLSHRTSTAAAPSLSQAFNPRTNPKVPGSMVHAGCGMFAFTSPTSNHHTSLIVPADKNHLRHSQ